MYLTFLSLPCHQTRSFSLVHALLVSLSLSLALSLFLSLSLSSSTHLPSLARLSLGPYNLLARSLSKRNKQLTRYYNSTDKRPFLDLRQTQTG